MSYTSEFETVDLILNSSCITKGVDAFALSLIKAERQMRKLFTFLVYQNPKLQQKYGDLRETLAHPVSAVHFEKVGKIFFPIFFDPPLRLFTVEESCPESIKVQLECSFALYWNDRSSCANKIRTVIELLMDHQKIPKPTGASLHSRIIKFKEQNPLFGTFLESAKWIGNVGSHSAKDLSKIDLLDGFEFLEHVINHLYLDNDNKIERLIKNSKIINENKGPKSR